MSGIAERLAEVLRGGWDDADALDAARALLPVVEREIAAARGEALREIEQRLQLAEDALIDNGPSKSGSEYRCGVSAGLQAGRKHAADLRTALSPDPDRGEGEA